MVGRSWAVHRRRGSLLVHSNQPDAKIRPDEPRRARRRTAPSPRTRSHWGGEHSLSPVLKATLPPCDVALARGPVRSPARGPQCVPPSVASTRGACGARRRRRGRSAADKTRSPRWRRRRRRLGPRTLDKSGREAAAFAAALAKRRAARDAAPARQARPQPEAGELVGQVHGRVCSLPGATS